MEELKKQIAGDWFDVREKSDTLYDLEETFSPSAEDLRALIKEIRLCVEEGLVEYKRTVLLPIFSFLESLKYDSKGLVSLPEQALKLSPLMYVILLQRLLCRGIIPLKKEKHSAQEQITKDVKEIIQDLNQRIQENPAYSQHTAVKNIFMQMNIYKKELEDMKKLSPNIPPDKADAFFTNFKNRFNSITKSIHDNYQVILNEDREIRMGTISVNPLTQIDMMPLAKICADQAQKAARIRSTLRFAKKEGFKTREYLVEMLKQKDVILAPFAKEEKLLSNLPGPQGKNVYFSKAFSSEITRILERQEKRMSEEGE